MKIEPNTDTELNFKAMVDRGRMRTALDKRELNVTYDSGLDLE